MSNLDNIWGIDDLGREAALRFHFPGAQRHLRRKILRQLRRRDYRCKDMTHHDEDVVSHRLRAAVGNERLE